MNDLVELVPNVSEGRRPARINRLSRVFANSGCALLDTHVDGSHHRSVFTAAGPLSAAMSSALSLTRAAASEIDLSQHRGIHPRVGAVDVIPFVSLSDSSAAQSALLAAVEQLAERIAKELEIPIFLYANSASPASLPRLAALRRGGLRGLNTRLRRGVISPDFGPGRVHPTAGATIIGVRDFLIAFNMFLDTAHASVARRIAQTIRASSGGLPALQAIGRFHDGEACAQVSMNLADYRKTSLVDAFEAVTSQARQQGVGVRRSELVGLVPDAAWTPEWQPRLKMTEPARTIEASLTKAGLA